MSSGAGLVLLLSASDLEDQARHAVDADEKTWLRERAQARWIAGGIFGAVGVAGLVVGIAKLATPEDSRSSSVLSGLTFGPGSITFTGSF